MGFTNKSALVTGGSRGIGKAITLRLARAGAHVTIVARTTATLEATVTEMSQMRLPVSGIVADFTEDDDIRRVVDEVVAERGSIDILVNNAAAADSARFLDLTRDQWERVVHSNLTSPFLASQTVARVMVRQGGGVIINISSISSHGADAMSNYSAAKAGLNALTRDIASELASEGVRCVTVSPGWIETELLTESVSPETLHTLRTNFRRVPMKRLLQPEEVANVVAFAASDEASGITGCEIVVDGGALSTIFVNSGMSPE